METAVHFSTEAMGYAPNQVDLYIQKLSTEYAALHCRYNELIDRYNHLATQSDANIKAAANTMTHAEENANQVIMDAKAEAARVIRLAQLELTQIRQEKDRIVSDISSMVNALQVFIS